MSKFVQMKRNEWQKNVSRTNISRKEALIDAIKAGDPISDIDGRDNYIANTSKNIAAINDFFNGKNTGPSFTLDLRSGGTIQSNHIGKSPLFGGQGVGEGATGETARFESLHCLYIAAMLKEGEGKQFSHFTYETLKKYSTEVNVSEPFEEYVKIDPSWHESSYEIAKALIQKKYINRSHTLHRGDRIMAAIYKAKNRVRKNEGKPSLQDDKWNPGDIWAIKRGTDVESLLRNVSTLSELNQIILKHFLDRTIVGISLKKVNKNKTVKLSDYNIEKSILDIHTFSNVTLETAKGKGIWTSKYGFFFFDNHKKADIRAPNHFASINFELQGSDARAGRTGWGQIAYSASAHLKKDMPKNTTIASQAKTLAAKKYPIKLAKDFYKLVKNIHPEISEDDFIVGLDSKQGQAHFIHALLGAAYIGSALVSSTKKQRDDFTSEIVNVMAAKTQDSSAYVKAEGTA